MIDYIHVKLTANYDGEIEGAIGTPSRMFAEAYVGCTRPYNPSWSTVDVHLGDYDEEGRPYEIGLAEITVRIEDAPLLRGLLEHEFNPPKWDRHELRKRAEAYEALEHTEYGRRVA